MKITNVPPPISKTNAAWRTYLGAVLFLLPSFVAWSFSTIFLMPKLEAVWHQVGLEHSRAQWLLDTSRLFKDNGYFVLVAVCLLFIVLETFWRAWPHFRWWVMASLVFVLNTAVLVGITIISISALLAVPMLTTGK